MFKSSFYRVFPISKLVMCCMDIVLPRAKNINEQKIHRQDTVVSTIIPGHRGRGVRITMGSRPAGLHSEVLSLPKQ